MNLLIDRNSIWYFVKACIITQISECSNNIPVPEENMDLYRGRGSLS